MIGIQSSMSPNRSEQSRPNLGPHLNNPRLPRTYIASTHNLTPDPTVNHFLLILWVVSAENTPSSRDGKRQAAVLQGSYKLRRPGKQPSQGMQCWRLEQVWNIQRFPNQTLRAFAGRVGVSAQTHQAPLKGFSYLAGYFGICNRGRLQIRKFQDLYTPRTKRHNCCFG